MFDKKAYMEQYNIANKEKLAEYKKQYRKKIVSRETNITKNGKKKDTKQI